MYGRAEDELTGYDLGNCAMDFKAKYQLPIPGIFLANDIW